MHRPKSQLPGGAAQRGDRGQLLKYARGASKSRFEKPAYTIPGTPERRHFTEHHDRILPRRPSSTRRSPSTSAVTAFLTSVLINCLQETQLKDPTAARERCPKGISAGQPAALLRRDETLRNFSSYLNSASTSAYGKYTFEEILTIVKHTLGLEISEKGLNARMTANVNSEKNFAVRAMPLFFKSPFLKICSCCRATATARRRFQTSVI